MTPMLGIMASQISGHLGPTYPYLAYDSIATTAVGSGGVSSITFSSIPSTYTHLQIRAMTKYVNAGDDSSGLHAVFNSDTAANYSFHYMRGTGTATSSGGVANASDFQISSAAPSTNALYSNMFGVSIIDILDYANTNKYKTTRSFSGQSVNTSTYNYIWNFSGNWRSTSAITNIVITPDSGLNWAQYSHFALYGIK